MMVVMTRNTLAPEVAVSHDPAVLTAGRINKSASDHLSVKSYSELSGCISSPSQA